MIKDIARQLMQDEDVWCGEAVNTRYLGDFKKDLGAEEGCGLPPDYVALLRYVNGAFSDRALLFGVMPESWPGLEDVVTQNERYNSDVFGEMILLGTNDFDWLVYDAAQEEYQIRERQGTTVIENFADLEQALHYWFF